VSELKAEAWVPTLDDPVVQEYIRDRVGPEGLEVARLIEDKQPVLGVDLLDLLSDQKPSTVRKVLYRLEDARVAEYQKDTDKTGWETFVWRLTLNEVKYVINRERHKLILDMEHELELERENSFYQCTDKHDRIIFADAMALEFKCPECADALNFVDSERRIQMLEHAVHDLKEIIF
jgi:transcription factor E